MLNDCEKCETVLQYVMEIIVFYDTLKLGVTTSNSEDLPC
jgi:hypothetical protein